MTESAVQPTTKKTPKQEQEPEQEQEAAEHAIRGDDTGLAIDEARFESQGFESQGFELQGPSVTVRELLEAGVHFGHQTKRWNPKMKPYIFGSRNGIHIIDLDQSAHHFRKALAFLEQMVARGGQILFVGTKSQASEIIEQEAIRASQFFVTGRWLGGTLTNFRTVKMSINRLVDLEQRDAEGSLDLLSKREALGLRRDIAKLQKYLGGIKSMNGLPAALFVVDPQHEHIAVCEARKLNIPIVALTDTNCDPAAIDFVIPGNDDAIRALRLIVSKAAEACMAGKQRSRVESFASGGAPEGMGAGNPVRVEFAPARRQRGGGAKSTASSTSGARDTQEPTPPNGG